MLQRPASVVVTYGLLTGFVAGIVCAGVWSFFSSVNNRGRFEPPVVQKSR
jgi:hypothetical protein